ncbi:MAG TPA: hypothetical protein VIG76_10195 [Amnibacterium sp.]|uniref:hypothetical protein n=1 Tax=Amnibacterium sp. TaxID=1872496 RepID=UPI002F94D9B3
MTTTGAERRHTAASGQALSALYLTLLFTVASLLERDGVPAVAALVLAVIAASFWTRHRFLVRHGRFATAPNRLTPRRASGSTAIVLATLAVMDGSEPLLHSGRWIGDGPAFFAASLATALIAAVVWLLLIRRDLRSAAQAS